MDATRDLITVLLNNRAPRTIDPNKWPVLLETPTAKAAAQYLGVRTTVGTALDHGSAIVYGHKGAGTGVKGAGIYAGCVLQNSKFTPDGQLDYDAIAAAIFAVGSELGFDKQTLWGLVQELPAQEL